MNMIYEASKQAEFYEEWNGVGSACIHKLVGIGRAKMDGIRL